MSGPEIAILADDLTGALDAVAPFAARGVPTVVATRPGAPLPTAEAMSLNAASRHLSAAEAGAAAAREGARLVALRPRLLFKKIDSTLRGQVVAETAALLAVSGRSRALIAPAFPAQGRAVIEGELRVHGVRLSDTPFVRDARSPAPTQPLRALFAGLPVETPDAESEADMARLARRAQVEAESTLSVGSAGLARALAALYPARPKPPRPRSGNMTVVVGSRSEEARRQADRLAAARDVTLLRPSDAAGDPESVAATLAARARAEPAGAFVVVGGDTAAALLNALGADSVEVLDELLPGIPLCRLPDGRLLATKAGAFGGEDVLLRILAELA